MRVVHQSCWAASSTAQHSYVGQLTKQFEPGKEPEAKGSSGGLEGAPHDVMVSRREPSTLERRAKHVFHKEPGSPKPAETSDLDFSVLQRSEQLNVDVTKQRISLRQKGSLAKRRRPTRNSMRSRGSSDGDLYEDSTEPKRTPRRIASHRTDEEEEEEDEDEPVFRPAPVHSNLEGKITPILLPGLAETSRPLRKSRPPVPLPKTRHASGPTDKVRGSPTTPSNGAGVPPWMSGMKIRRSSQTPIKVVLENTKDCEPQTPPWLKDVLIKKKRPSDIPEKRASQQPAETEEPATPPWMKERALRMSNRPSLQKTIQKDVANNNNANVQPASMEDDTLNKCSSPLIIDYDSSRPSWLTNSESLRSRGREILAPIKRSGSTVNNVYSEGSDENTPPPEGSVSSRTSSVENTPQKHILPPLNTSPSLAHSGQENSETAVPAWRIEIAARRKSKTFVPVHKPESPLRLGETPVWKRELSERNKVKKRGSMEGNPSSEAVTDAASPTLPPWKAELAQRKRRPPNINRETLEKSSTDEPEWTKNVELRRARLANVGLIDHTTEGSSR